MIAIVYSARDPVGLGVASRILSTTRWAEASCARSFLCRRSEDLQAYLAGFPEDSIYMEFLDEVFGGLGVSAYLVLSRHASRSGRPSLTVHSTGNYGEAEYGGRPRELGWSNPTLEGALLRKYFEAARSRGLLERYWIGLEATHHGPTGLRTPITFIEIGSTEAEWSDAAAQEAMAEAVVEALSSPAPACERAAGFGGTHYPERHTKLMLEGGLCYGHVLARYALQYPDRRVIGQAMQKNSGGISKVVVERKSVGAEARRAIEEEAAARKLDIMYI